MHALHQTALDTSYKRLSRLSTQRRKDNLTHAHFRQNPQGAHFTQPMNGKDPDPHPPLSPDMLARLFVPAAVYAFQLHAPPELTGAQLLCARMLETAIADLRRDLPFHLARSPTWTHCAPRPFVEDALGWIASPSSAPFSFIYVCEALHLHAPSVRKLIKRFIITIRNTYCEQHQEVV